MIAIGAAIVTGIEAVGAIGAIGTAAFGIGDALMITAALGATLGAVGVVTHDKTLQMAGLVIGGIGAIGSLANAAGIFGDTGSLFGSAADAAPSFPSSVDITPQIAGTGVGGAAGASAGIVDSFGGVDTAAFDPAVELAQQTDAAAGLGQTAVDTGASAMPAAAAGITPTTALTPPTGSTGASSVLLQQPSGVAAPPTPGAPPPMSPAGPAFPDSVNITPQIAGSPSLFERLGNFVQNTPGVGYGLIQAGGSFINGLFGELTPAQAESYKAQAAANRAAASLSTMQQQNIAQPIPVASRAVQPSVTGQPVGLINRPPAPTAVTGVPT